MTISAEQAREFGNRWAEENKPKCFGEDYEERGLKMMAAFASSIQEEARREFSGLLEDERTKVAEAITGIRSALSAREWLTEGRGCYEWDDDKWHDEFAAAISEIRTAIEPLDKIAGDQSNCPKDWNAVIAARADWKKRAETAEQQLAEARAQVEEESRWKTEKRRIYVELGLPDKACLGEIIQGIQAARAQGMREAAEIAQSAQVALNDTPLRMSNRIAAAIREQASPVSLAGIEKP